MGRRLVTQLGQFGYCHGGDVNRCVSRLRLLSERTNTAPIVPTDFSCPIFYAGYNPRCLLKWFNQRSVNKRPLSFVNLYSVAADFGAFTWGSSKTDVPPRWNSSNKILTIAIEGKGSLYTAFQRFTISLHNFPSKDKNRITDQYCSFSIFLKLADVTYSTHGINTIVPQFSIDWNFDSSDNGRGS